MPDDKSADSASIDTCCALDAVLRSSLPGIPSSPGLGKALPPGAHASLARATETEGTTPERCIRAPKWHAGAARLAISCNCTAIDLSQQWKRQVSRILAADAAAFRLYRREPSETRTTGVRQGRLPERVDVVRSSD